MWIDVGSLIRQHTPDKDGNVLPENASMGSYEIHELGQMGIGSLFEGKVVYDKTYGHVTYGCATCCGLKEWQFDYNPLGIPLDGTSQQSVEGVNNCQGTWTDITGYFNGGSWATANHAIATVNTNGLHSGASEGSTTTSACSKNDMTVWENFDHCPLLPVCPDGATDNVIPSFIRAVSSSNDTLVCLGLGCETDIQYEVADAKGNPIPKAGMTVQEYITVVSNTCGSSINDSSTWYTDSTGKLQGLDGIRLCCSQGQTCGLTVNQTFTVNGYPVNVMGASGLPVGTHNSITLSCTNGTGSCPIIKISQ